MKIALKEANETDYWLRLIQATVFNDAKLQDLITECNEIICIVNTLKKGQKH